jgi:hypothetical protein
VLRLVGHGGNGTRSAERHTGVFPVR